MYKFISFILTQKYLIFFAIILIIAGGIISWQYLKVDAFPDVTNVQVMILTEAKGLAPFEVERLITIPVEVEMNGLPYVKLIRSLSKAGLSQVVIIFEDWVNIYFARQIVFEKLQKAKENLPEGFNPELVPISTGLGEIYQYVLQSEKLDLMKLREIQDWIIRPQLRTVSGVNDVNSFGGFVKQYQVIVDPQKLIKYNLTLDQINNAIESNNAISSANYIVKGSEQIIVRGVGLVNTIFDIENIIVASYNGVPVYVRDVADVRIGHEVRWGAVTMNGNGEVVCGMVIMLKDANSKTVVDKVKEKISDIQKRLPSDVKITPFYDRTELIQASVNTISFALIQGIILVILILFLILGDLRTTLIVCLSLPLSIFLVFIAMNWVGLTANLMSLGGLAIAIGMIVDANIVVAENIFRHISEKKEEDNLFETCVRAITEVTKPVSFAIMIIVLVFVPLFTLQAQEGKMFKPLALTLMLAIFSSLLVCFLITPVLGYVFIKKQNKNRKKIDLVSLIRKVYNPVLTLSLKFKKTVIFISVLIFLASLFLLRFIGTEFLPYLDEGSIALNVVKFPTASVEESKKVGELIERILMKLPEVSTVVSKTGRAEIAEDPMGPEQNDVFIMLKPKKFWKVKSKTELIELIEEKLNKIPGLKLNFSQPIALRVNELISGIKSDIAIKIFGYDLDLLLEKADEIEAVISDIEGVEDLKVEQISGFLQLDIIIDRNAIARYGMNVSDINTIIETAIGGKTVGFIYDEEKKFNISVRFPENMRNDEEAIGNLMVQTKDGYKVLLKQLANIKLIEAPNQISRENGMRRVVVECNIRGRDIGSFVKEAKRKIQHIEDSLPSGYFIEWGGQFENQQRATKQLSFVLPLVTFLIFGMLFLSFNSLKPSLIVIANLPFALVGGIIAIIIFKITLSVSAIIGFIALFGIAVENGVVLVSFFIQLRKSGLPLRNAVLKACDLRLRPLLLTTLTTLLGLMPLLWASGPGSEIQKPLAIVVLGGLVSSWFLTLIVLPALYIWFEKNV